MSVSIRKIKNYWGDESRGVSSASKTLTRPIKLNLEKMLGPVDKRVVTYTATKVRTLWTN